MQATYTVRLRERGQLTLPQTVRRDLAVDDGDILELVQMDDLVWLFPRRALLPKLSKEFTALMEAESVSMADLLQGLEEQRKAIARERQISGA
jgi:bifunctional DNA-binding transcriptional regulator/antitoxin component of YhaV-PrlF toxin-antitoxin module